MPSTDSKPLVLITGATGHIGFRTLIALLQSDRYTARISVRAESQIATLKGNASLSPHLSSVESFVIVPDITANDAFDIAVENVEYIVHLASPIPDLTIEDAQIRVQQDFLIPAIRGTRSILESAAKSPSVKRVVVTSSVVALARKEGKSDVGPYDLAPVPDVNAEFPQNRWIAYGVSKVLAHDAGSKFMEEAKPNFDLIRILPSYTQGRNDLVKESAKLNAGSNNEMIDLIKGKKSTTPRTGALVLVDDVADLHIKALDQSKAKNGENFIAAGPAGKRSDWADVEAVVKKLFPKAVKKGIVRLGGEQPTYGENYDIENSVETLGYNPRPLEDMVKSLVGQYIELVENETRN